MKQNVYYSSAMQKKGKTDRASVLAKDCIPFFEWAERPFSHRQEPRSGG